MNTTATIPVVDIAGDFDEQAVGEQLIKAVASSGFDLQVQSPSDDSIDKQLLQSRNFFASPVEEKEKYKISENNRGWSGMHSETLDAKNQRVGDFKEAFNFAEFKDNAAQQALHPIFQAAEPTICSFDQHCHTLCLKILRLLALGLHVESSAATSSASKGSDAAWFSSRHSRSLGPSGTIMRLLHYPSVPADADYDPDVDIRAGAHSDYGSITLLFQRNAQPGLQILSSASSVSTAAAASPGDDFWSPVPVRPPGTEADPSPPILVNIGDLLSYWTNGLLKSTVHRVIFPKEGRKGGDDRYSIAYFLHPTGDTRLEPVPSEMVRELGRKNRQTAGPPSGLKEINSDEGAQEGEMLTAHEHLMKRLKATYLGLYRDEEKKEKKEEEASK